jgi:hypothetical protein
MIAVADRDLPLLLDLTDPEVEWRSFMFRAFRDPEQALATVGLSP